MPGRVLTEALDVEPPGPAVASYETGARAGDAGRPRGDSRVDPEILERLQSLGYLGGDLARRGERARHRSPQGDRNLAAMLFEAGQVRGGRRGLQRSW